MPSLGELTITVRIENVDEVETMFNDMRKRIHDIANRVNGKVGAMEAEIIAKQIATEVVEAALNSNKVENVS